jgi:hypothetical protein
MTKTTYRKLTLSLIGVWLLFAVTASALKVFENDRVEPPLPLLLAAVVPLALFGLWLTLSKGFREFTASLSPRVLTLAQTWRITGFVFLILAALGSLAPIFAIPAGLGDMAIGATAPLIAKRFSERSHRSVFLAWQFLGLADLVMAVGLGATARLLSEGTSMVAMTVLPMSLVPTFLVPLFLMVHVICIAQALRWPGRTYLCSRRQAASTAM